VIRALGWLILVTVVVGLLAAIRFTGRAVVRALAPVAKATGSQTPDLEQGIAGPDRPNAPPKNAEWMSEVRAGRAGPAVYKALDEAQARGELDKIKVKGKSLTQYMSEARDISAQAERLRTKREAEMRRANGDDSPRDDDPDGVIAESIAALAQGDPGQREMAARTLSDLRYAANAERAVPALQAAANDPDPGVRDAVALALERIKYCSSSALCRDKWRTK